MRYKFRGLIFGGAYTWRGLFSEFYGTCAAGPTCPLEQVAVFLRWPLVEVRMYFTELVHSSSFLNAIQRTLDRC